MGRKLKGSILSKSREYECQHDWPEDCFVQYGDSGIVFEKGTMQETLDNPEKGLNNIVKAQLGAPSAPKHYRTAFFEAFPNDPKTFIRGEGATVEEAETKTWEKFQKYSACNHPKFERRKYRNGAGFCVSCNMFKSKAFEPLDQCIVCEKHTNYSRDDKGNYYCEYHNGENPDRLEVKYPEMFKE